MGVQSSHVRNYKMACVVGVGLLFGCGGDDGPGGQFCKDFAATFCHKIYQCPPPEGLAGGLAGTSEADCTNGWTHICADPPPAGTTVDVNCSGGKHVNQAAKTLCFEQITSATCEAFNDPTFYTNCDQVCVDSSPTGAGGTTGSAGSGGGGTGGGGGGTSGTGVSTVLAFCQTGHGVDCDKAFECTDTTMRDAAFVAQYGSTITECKAKPPDCSTATSANCPNYSQVFAEACLMKYATEDCDTLALYGLPPECLFVCQ